MSNKRTVPPWEAPTSLRTITRLMSFSVPSDAFEWTSSCVTAIWRTTLGVMGNWVVTSNTSKAATPVRPSGSRYYPATAIRSTITRQDMTLEYSIKGVTMIKKEKPVYQGNNPGRQLLPKLLGGCAVGQEDLRQLRS